MWCVPEISEEFVERMEDVLEVYARPADAQEPVVCLDERPVVLRGHVREGASMRCGQVQRVDYEYERCGTANIFCIVEPLTGRRLTHATRHRKGSALARALRKVERRYRKARTIHLVVDNLSTRSLKCVTDALGVEARTALWSRFTIHFTPKHASWLNAAELEASLVARECLGRRRFPDFVDLRTEVAAWNRTADKARLPIRWKFRIADARRVFHYDGIITKRSEH